MNFVFLLDPLESLILKKDTSYILMLAAIDRGHNVYYLSKYGLFLKDNDLRLHVTRIIPPKNYKGQFEILEDVVLDEQTADAIFIRTDPPFDSLYITHTWLLDACAEKVFVLNSPHGLRTVNEKIWAHKFSDLMPKTIITTSKREYNNFRAEIPTVILKPVDGFGGNSIFLIKENDPNANAAFESVSENSTRYTIVQQYIGEADQGDKRILLLDGEPLGAILRLHGSDDHRNNFAAGGVAVKTEINDRDKEICARLKPWLQELDLAFVGIDIIGHYLIEVNVTSPTCLQEMNQMMNSKFEYEIIEYAEKRVKALTSSN